MKKYISIVLSLLFVGLFIACNNGITELDSGRGTISGTVTYSNASDASNIYLSVEKLEQITAQSRVGKRDADSPNQEIILSYVQPNAEGQYSFKDIDVGTYNIYATSDTCVEQAVCTTVTVTANTIVVPDDLTLTATGKLKGVVTIDGNETDNNGILVFISGTSYLSITDKKGNFTLSDIPAGKDYEVAVMKGTDSFDWTTSDVTAFETTDLGTLDLDSSKFTKAADGKDGISLKWLGSFAYEAEIVNPENLSIYYNTTTGCSYIYINGSWTLLAKAGQKGDTPLYAINWLGEITPDQDFDNNTFNDLDAYYNTYEGCSYIYYQGQWYLLASKGEQGEKGDKGDTGDSEQRYTYSTLHYTLQLASMEGSFPQLTIPEEYTPGAALVLPNPTCEGKDFAGWFLDNEFMKECEYVSYNESNKKYTLTVPASYTGTLTLYAAFGKVCYSWEDFQNCFTQTSGYGLNMPIFFSGEIIADKRISCSSFPTSRIVLRGINNAKWILRANIESITYVGAEFSMANITVDGGGQYSFTTKLSTSFGNFTLYNCTFKNLCTSDIVNLTGSNSVVQYKIEKCKFLNNEVTNTVIGLYGVSGNYVYIKDCIFDSNDGGQYSTIFCPNGYLSLENCKFINNTLKLDTYIMPGTSNYCNVYFNAGVMKLKGNIEGLKVYYPLSDTNARKAVDCLGETASAFMLDNVETEVIEVYVTGSPCTTNTTPEIANVDGSPVTSSQFDKFKFVLNNGQTPNYNRVTGQFEFGYVNITYPEYSRSDLGYEESNLPTTKTITNQDVIITLPAEYTGTSVFLDGKSWDVPVYSSETRTWTINYSDAPELYRGTVSFHGTDSEGKKYYVEYNIWGSKSGSKITYSMYEYDSNLYFTRTASGYTYTITTDETAVVNCPATNPTTSIAMGTGTYTFTLKAESDVAPDYTKTETMSVNVGSNSLVFE